MKSGLTSSQNFDFNEKFNQLAENLQSLLDKNSTINDELTKIKSSVQSVSNQIQQIDVSLIFVSF